MTLSLEEQQLFESVKKTSLTRALVFKSNQIDFERLLRTLQQDFPDVYVVYKATSGGKLRIVHET